MEIGHCAQTLQAPETVKAAFLQNRGEQRLYLPGGDGQLFGIHPKGIIPAGAFYAPTGIVKLAKDHIPGDAAALSGVS